MDRSTANFEINLASMPSSNYVGVFSIAVAAYSFFLFQRTNFNQFEYAPKLIVGLSYSSLLCMALAAFFIAMTYYAPRLGTTGCYCYHFWSAALVSYVTAIYLLKSKYIARIYLISKSGPVGSELTKQALIFTVVTLSAGVLMSYYLVITQIDGECHADNEKYGCLALIDLTVCWTAMKLIAFDFLLFVGFCYKSYQLANVLRFTEKNGKIPEKVVGSFINQFVLTVVAMSSCVVDGAVQSMLYDDGKRYNIAMIAFLIDVAVVGTCNYRLNTMSFHFVRPKYFKRN